MNASNIHNAIKMCNKLKYCNAQYITFQRELFDKSPPKITFKSQKDHFSVSIIRFKENNGEEGLLGIQDTNRRQQLGTLLKLFMKSKISKKKRPVSTLNRLLWK